MPNTMNTGVLTLREYMEVVDDLDAISSAFNDDVLDKASYYDITYDEASMMYDVTLYNDRGAILASVKVEDPDVAEVFLEEEFDMEPLDPEEVDPGVAATGTRWGHSVGGSGSDEGAHDSRYGINSSDSILVHDDGTSDDSGDGD